MRFIKSCLPKICVFNLYWLFFRLAPQLFLYISSNSVRLDRKKSDVKRFAFSWWDSPVLASLNWSVLYGYTHALVACITPPVAWGSPIHFRVFPCSFSVLDRKNTRVCFICVQSLELSRFTESWRESIHLVAKELKYKGNSSESPCSDLLLWPRFWASV